MADMNTEAVESLQARVAYLEHQLASVQALPIRGYRLSVPGEEWGFWDFELALRSVLQSPKEPIQIVREVVLLVPLTEEERLRVEATRTFALEGIHIHAHKSETW